MKKLFKSLSLLLASIAVVTATSCSDDLGKEMPVDSTGGNSQNENGAGVYLGINFSMPGMGQNGRSYTSDDNASSSGTEVGTDVENNINEVMLVLATPDDYGFIAASTVQKNKIYVHNNSESNAGSYHATAKITKTALSEYYTSGDAGKNGAKVAVFVIVNPSGAIVDALNSETLAYGTSDWIQTIGTVTATGSQTEGAIWSSTNGGSFLMSNRDIAIRTLPATLEDWNAFTKEDNAFKLSEVNDGSVDNSSATNGGAVKVERVAARMDFRDASSADTPANTYHVIYQTNADGTDDEGMPIVDIQLNKMCLVNMSNSFYYLPRVSDNGLNATPATASTNGWALCGPEKPWYTSTDGTLSPTATPGNYVVSTYAQEKFDGTIIKAVNGQYSFDTYFNYPFFQNSGEVDNNNAVLGSSERWYVSSIDDVLAGTQSDNWTGPTGANQYKVWRYLTENTIPGDADLQTNGVSTGVVFKGKMIANEDAKLDLTEFEEGTPAYKNAEARNYLIDIINNESKELGDTYSAPILYYVAGSLYASWENLYQAAINASFSYEWNASKTGIIVSWNRQTTLYKAVFGDKGGLTGYSITVTPLNDDGTEYGDPVTYTDKIEQKADDSDEIKAQPFYETFGLDPDSPNYLYGKWVKDERPDDGPTVVAFKKAATGNDIALYQRSNDSVNGWGYYCYYYYWNRHNDNANNGVMTKMEFGVVRNNVYKLAVTKISRIGHPRIFANDPVSPKPNTPNESEDVYITVDSRVLPWVVRENNIVFD